MICRFGGAKSEYFYAYSASGTWRNLALMATITVDSDIKTAPMAGGDTVNYIAEWSYK